MFTHMYTPTYSPLQVKQKLMENEAGIQILHESHGKHYLTD